MFTITLVVAALQACSPTTAGRSPVVADAENAEDTMPAHVSRVEHWEGQAIVRFLQRNGTSWRDQDGRPCDAEAVSTWLASIAEAPLQPADAVRDRLHLVGDREQSVAVPADLAPWPPCASPGVLGIAPTTRSVQITLPGQALVATRGPEGWVDASGTSVDAVLQGVAAWAHQPRLTAQVVDEPWGTIVVTQADGTDTFDLGPPASHGADHWALHRQSQTVFRIARDQVEALVGASYEPSEPMSHLGGRLCVSPYYDPPQHEAPILVSWLMHLDGGDLLVHGCGKTHPMMGRTALQLRWESPGGVMVLSPAGAAFYSVPEVESRPPDELVWTVWVASDPYSPFGGHERSRFTYDAATHRFLEAAPVERRSLEEWHEARIAAAVQQRDYTLALAERTDPYSYFDAVGAGRLAMALHPHLLELHRAGKDREAADLVLAVLPSVPERRASQVPVLDPEGIRRAVAQAGEPYEVMNDLGFLLHEGGEAAAAAVVLAEVVRAAGETRPVAMLNLADVLHELGDPAAAWWYRRYAEVHPEPVARALERQRPLSWEPSGDDLFSTVHFEAPAGARERAQARYAAALEQGALAVAYGAAVSGGFDPRATSAWWEAAARDLVARVERGDAASVQQVTRLFGRPPAAQRDALLPVLLPLHETLRELPLWRNRLHDWFGTPRNAAEAGILRHNVWFWQHRDGVTLHTIGKVRGEVCLQTSEDLRCSGGVTAEKKEVEIALQPRRLGNWRYPSEWPTAERPCVLDSVRRVRCDAPLDRAPRGHDVADLTMGRAHACALHDTRELECWGDDRKGQAPASVRGVVGVIADADWTCIVDEHNQPRCFGEAPELPELPALATNHPPEVLWGFHHKD